MDREYSPQFQNRRNGLATLLTLLEHLLSKSVPQRRSRCWLSVRFPGALSLPPLCLKEVIPRYLIVCMSICTCILKDLLDNNQRGKLGLKQREKGRDRTVLSFIFMYCYSLKNAPFLEKKTHFCSLNSGEPRKNLETCSLEGHGSHCQATRKILGESSMQGYWSGGFPKAQATATRGSEFWINTRSNYI